MKENTNSKETQGKKDYTWRWLGLWLLVLLVVCLVYPFILRSVIHWLNPGDMEKYGVFGDMYGAPNAFISGCAFIGVVYSLLQQKKQLELQRKDLKLQRNDLALQREEMQKAREEAERQTQQFEAQVQLGKDAQFADDFFRRMELLNTLQEAVVYSPIHPPKYAFGEINGKLALQNNRKQQKDFAGISAWKEIHKLTLSFLKEGTNVNSILIHEETLPTIVAWQMSVSILIRDIKNHFKEQNDKNFSSEQHIGEKHYIQILLNSFSLYQKDFLVLLLDAISDSEIRSIRSYLYKNDYLSKEIKISNPFVLDSENRKKLLQELEKTIAR